MGVSPEKAVSWDSSCGAVAAAMSSGGKSSSSES